MVSTAPPYDYRVNDTSWTFSTYNGWSTAWDSDYWPLPPKGDCVFKFRGLWLAAFSLKERCRSTSFYKWFEILKLLPVKVASVLRTNRTLKLPRWRVGRWKSKT